MTLDELIDKAARIECNRQVVDVKVILIELVPKGYGTGGYEEVARELDITTIEKVGGLVLVRTAR